MVRSWSKGTKPLVLQKEHHAQDESSKQGVSSSLSDIVSSVSGAASGDEASRRFLLRVVQPGLAGLMDGSVSTLAPIFAAAFVTHHLFTAFIVGIAAATGAGISMAFSEAVCRVVHLRSLPAILLEKRKVSQRQQSELGILVIIYHDYGWAGAIPAS